MAAGADVAKAQGESRAALAASTDRRETAAGIIRRFLARGGGSLRCAARLRFAPQVLGGFAPAIRAPTRWLQQVAASFGERARRAQVAPERLPLVELDRQQVVA